MLSSAISHAIHPVKLGDRQKRVHFFVEFTDQACVKRARAVQLPDVKVHVLAYSQQLIDQFLVIAPTTVAWPSASSSFTSMVEAGSHRSSPHTVGASPMRRGGKHCS